MSTEPLKLTTLSVKRANPNQMKLTEYSHQRYRHTTDAPVEALADPSYWTRVARQVKTGDVIEVAHLSDYYAELYVREAHAVGLIIGFIKYVSFAAPEKPLADIERLHEAKHKGAGQFGVIRLSDGNWVGSTYGTKELAVAAAFKLDEASAVAYAAGKDSISVAVDSEPGSADAPGTSADQALDSLTK